MRFLVSPGGQADLDPAIVIGVESRRGLRGHRSGEPAQGRRRGHDGLGDRARRQHGCKVINISRGPACRPTRSSISGHWGRGSRYAAVDKDAVIVAAAGTCVGRTARAKTEPLGNPLTPDDPRNWAGVTTVVTPAWFSDYVLTVGAVNAAGNPLPDLSIAGPWVGIAAPGTDVMSLTAGCRTH